jgi:hypothetical protein
MLKYVLVFESKSSGAVTVVPSNVKLALEVNVFASLQYARRVAAPDPSGYAESVAGST